LNAIYYAITTSFPVATEQCNVNLVSCSLSRDCQAIQSTDDIDMRFGPRMPFACQERGCVYTHSLHMLNTTINLNTRTNSRCEFRIATPFRLKHVSQIASPISELQPSYSSPQNNVRTNITTPKTCQAQPSDNAIHHRALRSGDQCRGRAGPSDQKALGQGPPAHEGQCVRCWV
jgi:hypothetical protein